MRNIECAGELCHVTYVRSARVCVDSDMVRYSNRICMVQHASEHLPRGSSPLVKYVVAAEINAGKALSWCHASDAL